MKGVLDWLRDEDTAASILDAVDGRFEAVLALKEKEILASPDGPAPPSLSALAAQRRLSTAGITRTPRSSTSSGITIAALSGISETAAVTALNGRLPPPPRVAVACADPTTSRVVAAALASASTSVSVHPSLKAAELAGAPVVVVASCPDTTLDLPPVSSCGSRRGYVVVGEVEPAAAELIFTEMCGWCELVRLPLAPAELRRRAAMVHAFVSGQPDFVSPRPTADDDA